MNKNLFFSIGNTNIYYAEVINNNIENKNIFDIKMLDNIKYKDYKNIYFISVNKKKSEKLKDILYKNFSNIIELKKKKNIFKSMYSMENIGVDRFMNLYYIIKHREYPCLIIDTGTCDTFDFVNNDGVHLGGYITAGLNTLSKSVNDSTDLLPLIEPDFGTEIPQNTESAIKYGIYFQWLNSIIYFINFSNNLLQNNKVIITGGNAIKVKDIIKNINMDRDLIFKGMIEYAKDYYEK